MTFLQAAFFNQYAFALHEPFNSYISQFKAGWYSFLKQKDLILNVGMISVQWGILYMFIFLCTFQKLASSPTYILSQSPHFLTLPPMMRNREKNMNFTKF